MIYGDWSHCNIARLKDDFTRFNPFDENGFIKPIKITKEGVEKRVPGTK
jgi:hypothetical protein